jgi:hypothetical protein
MDVAVIANNSGVFVPMKYTYLSGGGLFYYAVPAFAPLKREHVYVAEHVVTYPGVPLDDEARSLLDAITVGNSTYAVTNAPDTKVLHIVSSGSDICISLYRFAESADPCAHALRPALTATPIADSIAFNVSKRPGAIIALELQAFSFSLNATVSIDNVPTYRISIVSYVADAVRGLRYNGTAIMLGGDGRLVVQRLEHKATSFWCDDTEIPYTLEYCVAPSMHLCKDLHYRAECKPSPDCHHGSYDRMLHECVCDNNWDGPYCQHQACSPGCVFGTCVLATNSCACWTNAYGSRCENYYTNTTNNTVSGNLTLVRGAIIVVYATNCSSTNNSCSTNYIAVVGTVIIQEEVQLLLMLSSLPRPGNRYTVLSYSGREGQFTSAYALNTNANTQPLDQCINYTVEYGEHMAEVVFTDVCAGRVDESVPWYVTAITVVMAVVVLIIVMSLLARYNDRVRRCLLPIRQRLHEYYRQKRRSIVVLTDGDDNDNAHDNAHSERMGMVAATRPAPRMKPLPRLPILRPPVGYINVAGATVLAPLANRVVFGQSRLPPPSRVDAIDAAEIEVDLEDDLIVHTSDIPAHVAKAVAADTKSPAIITVSPPNEAADKSNDEKKDL